MKKRNASKDQSRLALDFVEGQVFGLKHALSWYTCVHAIQYCKNVDIFNFSIIVYSSRNAKCGT